MQQDHENQVILKKLRIWRLVALSLSLLLLVMIIVNRHQAQTFHEQTRLMLESEQRKNDQYQAVVETVQKAFDLKHKDNHLNGESKQ
jgi:hypothetical protein